jgi:PAS domain S-box-containing protein
VRSVYELGTVHNQDDFLLPIVVDGQLKDRFWTYSFRPIYEHGRIAGVLNTVVNVTEKVFAAARLKASEARNHRILHSIGDGVLVVAGNGCVSQMNKAAEGLTGWTEAEAQGRPLSEIFHVVSTVTGQRLDPTLTAALPHPRQPQSGAEMKLIARNGSESYIEDGGAVAGAAGGAADGSVIVFRDVSARQRAEQERDALQQELRVKFLEMRAIYDISPVVLGLIDPATLCYISGNRTLADVLELSVEQIPGTPVLAYSGGNPELRNVLERAAAGSAVIGKVIAVESPLTDGVRYWQAAYIPVFAEDGGVHAIAGSAIDITAQRKMQEAMMQSEKLAAVGRLAASIAHEINNPLEAVTNLLYLSRSSEDMDEVQEYLAIADRELKRAALITNQTLRFHRQSTKPALTDCHELVVEALSIFHGRVLNCRITVDARKRTDTRVKCFSGEIRQVINNLVGNAIDAMETTGGRLVVRSRNGMEWRSGRRGVVMTIADTGPGMSRQVQKKIFEAFYTTKEIRGTGLGLWVSREIIDRHKGALRVRSSQLEGRTGTVFTFFLPREAAVERAAS